MKTRVLTILSRDGEEIKFSGEVTEINQCDDGTTIVSLNDDVNRYQFFIRDTFWIRSPKEEGK